MSDIESGLFASLLIDLGKSHSFEEMRENGELFGDRNLPSADFVVRIPDSG